jgi:DNA-binding HxlR family transcriptional regulator
MPAPRVGRPVRGSRTGRPIMVLLDALGRRWALRVLWELSSGPRTFRALRADAGAVSPSVLNARLRELRDLGLVATGAEGYQLTGDGEALCRLLLPLDRFAEKWAAARARKR